MTEVQSGPVPELKDEQETGSSVPVEGESWKPEDGGANDAAADSEATGDQKAVMEGDETNNDPSPSTEETAEESSSEQQKKPTKNPKTFKRNSSSFLRVSDLDLPHPSSSASTNENLNGESADEGDEEEDQLSHFHHPSADPPPGLEKDDKEKFIAIGSHDGIVAPIAPVACEKLATYCLETALNQDMWTPDGKTKKLIQKAKPDQDWITHTFAPGAFSVGDSCNFHDKEVFVWTGSFSHNFYGGDLPAIRTSGTVNMSAEYLVDLLLDSSRVKEYNRLMVERTDVQVFADDLYNEKIESATNPFGACVAKFTRAISKPPLVNRLMIFNNLCYAKKLPDGSGYLVCNRAIYNSIQPEDEPTNVIKSEVLLGVNLIRHLKDKEGNTVPDKCVMTNVNHMRSPKVPLMIAKKVGMNAAIGYLNDFRGAAERLAASKSWKIDSKWKEQRMLPRLTKGLVNLKQCQCDQTRIATTGNYRNKC